MSGALAWQASKSNKKYIFFGLMEGGGTGVCPALPSCVSRFFLFFYLVLRIRTTKTYSLLERLEPI